MTGPEHYREAVSAASEVADDAYDGGKDALGLTFAERIALAQVHATLALAAATVADRGIGPEELSGWRSYHVDGQWRQVTQ